MACEAKPRTGYGPSGWVCTGEDLVKVMDGPDGVPVVVPRWAVPELMAEEWLADIYHPQPFAGGDHYHGVLSAMGR
jgi:hypothetical protein